MSTEPPSANPSLPEPAPPAASTTQEACPPEQALARRAIGGVLRNAQNGELPLFGWTLGLPQHDMLAMLQRYFPELAPLDPLPSGQYEHLRHQHPSDFQALVTLLLFHRSEEVDPHEARWLAHAISAACFGERHLWEDLGLGGRPDVSALLKHYFGPLYLRNTRNLRWKRFLFAELGTLRGLPDLVPPSCQGCDERQQCFSGKTDI
ncbi:MAG: nitrogen fixation protein NifQ [Lautropia sp.]|nr:nitrogen fixation protein NifQ [Lautropia sp.]